MNDRRPPLVAGRLESRERGTMKKILAVCATTLLAVGLVSTGAISAQAGDFPKCDGSTTLPKSTELNTQGWVFLDGNTDAVLTPEYTADGLRLNSSGDLYIKKILPAPVPLAQLESVSFDSTPTQSLGVNGFGGLIFRSSDNPSTVNFHYEPLYADALWTNRLNVLPPGAGGGSYSSNTFADLITNPSVTEVWFWVNGGHDVTLKSLTFNCTTQAFGLDTSKAAGEAAAAPTAPSLADSGFDATGYVIGGSLFLGVGVLTLMLGAGYRRKLATK